MQTHIRRATIDDAIVIVNIGLEAVELSHRASCSVADMNYYLDNHYNEGAIRQELSDPANIYHLIYHNDQPAGFSKIILNAAHPNIADPNTTKLDRIYLLERYYGMDLGRQLLNRSIAYSKENDQCGIWLFTWTGNERAVSFYKRNGFLVVGEHLFKVSESHYNPNFHMLLRFQ